MLGYDLDIGYAVVSFPMQDRDNQVQIVDLRYWKWDGRTLSDQLWVKPRVSSGDVYMTAQPDDRSTWVPLARSYSRMGVLGFDLNSGYAVVSFPMKDRGNQVQVVNIPPTIVTDMGPEPFRTIDGIPQNYNPMVALPPDAIAQLPLLVEGLRPAVQAGSLNLEAWSVEFVHWTNHLNDLGISTSDFSQGVQLIYDTVNNPLSSVYHRPASGTYQESLIYILDQGKRSVMIILNGETGAPITIIVDKIARLERYMTRDGATLLSERPSSIWTRGAPPAVARILWFTIKYHAALAGTSVSEYLSLIASGHITPPTFIFIPKCLLESPFYFGTNPCEPPQA